MNTRFLSHKAPWPSIAAFILLAALFIFTAFSRIPVEIRSLAVTVRYSFTVTSIGLLLLMNISLRLPSKWQTPAVFAMVGAVFGLALAGLWASGQSEPYVVSGLIPYNDAATYYIDANRLLDGSLFSDASSRRPLAPGMLSALLGFTGRNLQVALALLTFVEAIACAYMTLAVRRSKGAAAGALVFWICFLFARRFIGTTMTESLGLTFGALALAFAYHGIKNRNIPYMVSGVFLLTLALNIRAGAFFLLPVIVLWIGMVFRGKGYFGWKPALLATLAVILGFGINSLAGNLIGSPGGIPFGNFSESLYGLASGGERWAFVYDQHPELQSMPEKERFQMIYQLSFDLIRQNPMGIVQGSLRQWNLLFSNTWFSLYAYVGGENVEGNRYVHWFLYALCLAAVFQSIRKWKESFHSFLLISILGIFLSVPFVPPGDAHKMRAFAATIPMLAVLPAIGLSELLNLTPLRMTRDEPAESLSANGIVFYSAFLTIFMVIAPVLFLKTAIPPVFDVPECQPQETPLVLRYNPGNEVRIIRESVLQLDWLPEFHFGRYKVFIHNLPNDESIAILEDIEPPATLLLGYDIPTGKKVWLLTGTEKMPSSDNGILQICGNYFDTDDPDIRRYGFYYPREITIQP